MLSLLRTPWISQGWTPAINHAHPLPFAFTRICKKHSVTLGFLEHEPPIPLYESVINLSLFQTLVLMGLTVRQAHGLENLLTIPT